MLLFQTPTILDLRAITTMGLNAKPSSDSPIGYFGTGLKYAIAAGTRLGLRITIRIGLEEYTFNTRQTDFRGKSFEMLVMHGPEGSTDLPYTTEYGKNWELWMVYRELWSNTKDEGGTTSIVSEMRTGVGKTHIHVTGLDDIHASRHEFLIEELPLQSDDQLEIHRGPASSTFYKGIAVRKTGNRSVLKYNILSSMRLTEDRTLSDNYNANACIAMGLLRLCTDKNALYQIMNRHASWEGVTLDFNWTGTPPNDTFLEVARDMYYTKPDDCNASIKSMVERLCPEITEAKSCEPTALEARTIAKAKAFLAKIDCDTDYPIVIVEDLGPTVLGEAKNGTIYLTKELLMKGTKYVAATIMEEHIHLRKGFHDCSREMQNWLFDKIVHMGEEITGEPL